jgi:hypothetical protein
MEENLIARWKLRNIPQPTVDAEPSSANNPANFPDLT